VDGDRSFQRLLDERRGDGATLMEIRPGTAGSTTWPEPGFPSVAIVRTAQPEGGWRVGLDHTALAAACVDHLADPGHRRVALVNRPEHPPRAGHQSALRALDGSAAARACGP
jgi:DNA-binding LacI/PurR family transcriptional regulator